MMCERDYQTMSFSHDHLHLTDSTSMKDPDVSALIGQNQTLAAELAQCQADKDFVWTLWKKLQVSNPDVTEAISLVIQREKEKAENKDRKILEIIQVKDDRIEELQNIVAKQAEEISDLLSKKVEVTEKNSRIQTENERLQELVTSLHAQIKTEEHKEKSLEGTFRRTIESAEKEKYELSRKVARLAADLEVARSEKAHATSRQKILEERIRTLEKEVSDKMAKFEELVNEVEDSSGRLTRYESQTSQQRCELEFKNQELENIRKELRELWTAHSQLTEHSGQQADLIRQLQSLQQDTQKMLKNQEDAFCMESTSLQQLFTDASTRYETSRRTEAELRQQILELKKNLMDRDDMISSLQSHKDVNNTENHAHTEKAGWGLQPEYSGSFLDMVQEVDSLSVPEALNRRTRMRSLNRPQGHEKSNTDLLVVRSRSLSPPTSDVEPRLEPFDVRKVARLQKTLDLKSRLLEEMKRAHDKRLHRFQNLQASYRLTRDEMKTMEFSRNGRTKKPKRADPRSLQKENSDQVWNELAFFKAENRTLEVDKMSLQEEVDLLRVQASSDAATVHELKMSAQSQREEYEFQLRHLNRKMKDLRDLDKQLSILKSQVQNKTAHIEKLERDIMSAVSQRDEFSQEKNKLTSQLSSLQQEASKVRMEMADLKHQHQSQRHELENLRHIQQEGRIKKASKDVLSKHNSYSVVSTVASRLLTKSKERADSSASKRQLKNRHKTKGTPRLGNFTDEEWEEISESENSDSESELPNPHTTILGRFNARNGRARGLHLDSSRKKVKPRRVPTHRPPHKKSVIKSSKRVDSRAQSQEQSQSSEYVMRREFATSPIAFLSPTLPASLSASSPFLNQAPAKFSQQPNMTTNAASNSSRRRDESRQVAALKQRVLRLQQQVSLLKKVKVTAVQSEEILREGVEKLKTELSSVTGRMKAAKLHVQNLQAEVEKLQKEKQVLESASPASKAEGRAEQLLEGQDPKALEAKLKVATSEVSKQSASIRTMKTENDGLQEQVKSLQDRINHLERDISQKRNLLESQRVKLKQAQETSKTDADNLEELETRNKLLTDSNNKMKVQLDSLKQRFAVVMRDRKEYEEKLLKVKMELDYKSRQLLEASSKKTALESALADLEKSAQQQLHALATQSETAIDMARDKLTASQTRLNQFFSVLKILASEIVSRAERVRSRVREKQLAQARAHCESDLSLKWAQDKAKDILNLSHSDLEDIMSADGDWDSQESVSGSDQKLDKRWLRKCDKLMNSKDDFVQPLVKLFLQKYDERADNLTKLL